MSLAPTSALMGGYVRAGLADSLQIARGKPAQSNAEQVTKTRSYSRIWAVKWPPRMRRARY